ncbi:lipoprotein [Streptomyces sannanensis]|uniref:Lipoprotein n=1 Tax=Streptomyces sannanensis TaxID=285536 RepID=A0ABP6SDN5_9ACTN
MGVSLAAVAVLAGAVGCQAGDGDKKAAGESKPATQHQSHADATQALTAAYQKTAAAKSAKVRMTMSMPASAPGGGDMEMTGVLGWDPTVMDMTMKGGAFGAAPGSPEQMRMVWQNNIMYMDMGAAGAKDMDGKRWMKLDLAAAAEASGDKAVQQQMAQGLENMNQDPAQQLALLLDSPNLDHLGPVTEDGVRTEHYKGKVTLDEMVASNKSLDTLSKQDRDRLLADMKKSGIKAYDTEVWVDKDGYPVRMDVDMDTPEGAVKVSAHYSDYGAAATVQAPPADETVDLFKMMKELGEGMKDGAGATAGTA